MVKPITVFNAILNSIKRRTFSKKQTLAQKLILFFMCTAVFLSGYFYNGVFFASLSAFFVFILVRWAHLDVLDLKEGLIFCLASIFTSIVFGFSKFYQFIYQKILKKIRRIEFFPEFPHHEQTFTKSITVNEMSLRDNFWGPRIKIRYLSPNFLTLFRIAGTFGLLFLFHQKPIIFFLIVLFLFLTDYFDGIIARTQNRITTFGIWADPIADRFLLAVVLFYFYLADPLFWGDALLKMAVPEVILLSSFILIFLIRRKISKPDVVVWGRFKFVFYFFALLFFMFGNNLFSEIMITLGCLSGSFAVASYLARFYTKIYKMSIFQGVLLWFIRKSRRIRLELSIKAN